MLIGPTQILTHKKLMEIKYGRYTVKNVVYPFKKTDKISVSEIFTGFIPISHAKRKIIGLSFREEDGYLNVQLNEYP